MILKRTLRSAYGVVLALGILSASASATIEPWQLKIDSFYRTGSATLSAELCGRVTGMQVGDSTWVKITVDPGSAPGTYNAYVSDDGKFCTVVSTRTGRAEVSFIPGQPIPGDGLPFVSTQLNVKIRGIDLY